MRRPPMTFGVIVRFAPALMQLGLGRLVRRARDDEDVGVERARGDRHEQVLGVGRERRDDGARAVDAGLVKHALPRSRRPGRTASPRSRAVSAASGSTSTTTKSAPSSASARATTEPTRPAPATIVWPLQLGDALLHAASLQEAQDVALEQELDELREREAERRDAGQDHEHRERLARARQRVDLAEPDRADRDHRHVQRVEEAPALDEHVADDARPRARVTRIASGQDDAAAHCSTASSRSATIERRLR